MKQNAQNRKMMDEEAARRWEKLAALETDVSGIKKDIAGLDGRLSELGGKLDLSLSRLFDKIETGTRRPTPWNIIFSFAGICATVVLSLAAWANAYFGQAIGAAQREAAQSMAAHGAMQAQINTARQELTAGAIERARIEERQKFITAELDRLRGGSHPLGHEKRNR